MKNKIPQQKIYLISENDTLEKCNKTKKFSERRATLQELNTSIKERNSKISIRAMKLEQMLFNFQKWNSQIKKKALHFKDITD